MSSHMLRAGSVVLALLIAGCGRGQRAQTDTAPEDTDTRLGETVDVKFDAWLELSRKDLAKLDAEWAATVNHQLDTARKAPDMVDLLPRLHAPVTLPVFQEARYSAK